MNKISIRPMAAADYDAVSHLWQNTAGVGLSRADSREAITAYLARNPGLSQVAYLEEEGCSLLVGAVLCGHDGRRGLLHHLAVLPEYRRQGIGRALVDCCIKGLAGEGIDKCHLFVFNENEAGQRFWKGNGWKERHELVLMSYTVDDAPLS
jgi:N-acetylglutamate synthase